MNKNCILLCGLLLSSVNISGAAWLRKKSVGGLHGIEKNDGEKDVSLKEVVQSSFNLKDKNVLLESRVKELEEQLVGAVARQEQYEKELQEARTRDAVKSKKAEEVMLALVAENEDLKRKLQALSQAASSCPKDKAIDAVVATSSSDGAKDQVSETHSETHNVAALPKDEQVISRQDLLSKLWAKQQKIHDQRPKGRGQKRAERKNKKRLKGLEAEAAAAAKQIP